VRLFSCTFFVSGIFPNTLTIFNLSLSLSFFFWQHSFELRASCLLGRCSITCTYSAQVMGIFKVGSLELFPQAGFELWPYWVVPWVARIIGVSHQCWANFYIFNSIFKCIMSVRWHLIVILVFSSLLISDVDHLSNVLIVYFCIFFGEDKKSNPFAT
jgi:hypothetical protein